MALTPALAELGSRLGAAVEAAEDGTTSEDEAPPPILEVRWEEYGKCIWLGTMARVEKVAWCLLGVCEGAPVAIILQLSVPAWLSVLPPLLLHGWLLHGLPGETQAHLSYKFAEHLLFT
jgi:hypothetical protein